MQLFAQLIVTYNSIKRGVYAIKAALFRGLRLGLFTKCASTTQLYNANFVFILRMQSLNKHAKYILLQFSNDVFIQPLGKPFNIKYCFQKFLNIFNQSKSVFLVHLFDSSVVFIRHKSLVFAQNTNH
ncbi:unnamed protein product [Paramecium octaurelia]|uniref:Uncharacterized protein n=1 Tax=Paramecium octaurelia TaxID=43137 RepID=A0A8S1YH55_PAROT|nr:unnamed protein product [Paramecium octaurelia]